MQVLHELAKMGVTNTTGGIKNIVFSYTAREPGIL